MELKKKIGIVLKKINRHGRENIVAVILLNVFIGIGFCAVLWLLRSYSIDFWIRRRKRRRGRLICNFRLFRIIWKCLPIS